MKYREVLEKENALLAEMARSYKSGYYKTALAISREIGALYSDSAVEAGKIAHLVYTTASQFWHAGSIDQINKTRAERENSFTPPF